MWLENITRDLGDFTSSLMEDTKGLASMVSRLAAEVTGHGAYIAGDEDSLLAQECPLDAAAIFALQKKDAVYLDNPREPEEKALFEEWLRRSVYSSANASRRDHFNGSGSGSSDDTAMTCRQRLLDDNPLVAEKYAALVRTGGHSPRGASTEAKATPERPSGVCVEGGAKTPAPLPTAPLSESQRVTEDAFFDHYFFRLSRLRLSTAAERRRREEGAAAARAKGKSLAERFMEATDELVGWGDAEPVDAGDPGAGETPHPRGGVARTEAEWRAQEEKTAALEALVRVLQAELSEERRRLAAVLSVVQQCQLGEGQMQRVHAAVAAAANPAAASQTPPARMSSSPLADGENTATGDGGAGHGEGGGDAATREILFSEEVHQQGGPQGNPASAANASSSLDSDSWTSV